MDGSGRALGAGFPIELGGTKYMLSPLTVKELGSCEQYLLSQRKTPLQIARENMAGLSDEDKEILLRAAIKETRSSSKIPAEEVKRWIDTLEGSKYTIWMMIRKNHPEMTMERVSELIDKMLDEYGEQAIAELLAKRDQASGIDDLGN